MAGQRVRIEILDRCVCRARCRTTVCYGPIDCRSRSQLASVVLHSVPEYVPAKLLNRVPPTVEKHFHCPSLSFIERFPSAIDGDMARTRRNFNLAAERAALIRSLKNARPIGMRCAATSVTQAGPG